MTEKPPFPGPQYGCHCDLDPDQAPDGCVIDEGRPQDCRLANGLSRKEDCREWRPIAIQRDALAAAAPAPYAWAVSGMARPFYGQYAEQDARAEVRRTGGTAEAFPLYRGPASTAPAPAVPEPYGYRALWLTPINDVNGVATYRGGLAPIPFADSFRVWQEVYTEAELSEAKRQGALLAEAIARNSRESSAPIAEHAKVYLVATGDTNGGNETYTRHDVRPPLCDAEVLYTAPQARRRNDRR